MLRVIFRSVLVITLGFLAVLRTSGSGLPKEYQRPFSFWFLFTLLVALVFLVRASMSAVKDQANRRYHIRDAMLAVVWIIFWVLNLGH